MLSLDWLGVNVGTRTRSETCTRAASSIASPAATTQAHDEPNPDVDNRARGIWNRVLSPAS